MKRIMLVLLSMTLSAALLLTACSSAAVKPTASVQPTENSTPATTAAPTSELSATPTLVPTASPATTTPAATPAPTATAAPTPPTSLTSGLRSDKAYKPINVMIENRPEARPQAGISQADIVYEALMEGRTMTRFQCVFNDTLPTNVGPVRSCRLYFIDIASEYKGLLAFFGGPSTGPAKIYPKLNKELYRKNIQVAANGITGQYGTNTKLYWRVTQRKAPHNVYTDLTKLDKLFTAPANAVSHFKFDTTTVLNGDDIKNIEIMYNKCSVDTKYVYDPALKKYKRFIDSAPMIDANNHKQVTVTNVIIQYADTVSMNTSHGHININLFGTGKADIFVGGKHIKATWKRPTEKEITRYYDASGKEVTLLPGNTWIQEVPTGGGVPVKFSK